MSKYQAKWDEPTTLKFVKLYSEHECLWNSAYPGYANKLTRREALQQIVKDIDVQNFGVDKAQYKIKNLRSTYVQELKKIQNWKCSGSRYVSALKWFPIMHAIFNKMPIKSESSHAAIDVISDSASQKDDQDSWEEANEQQITEEVGLSKVDNVIGNISSNIKKGELSGSKGDEQITDEVVLSEIDTVIDAIISYVKKRSNVLQNEVTNEGDCELFGKHIALQLRKLPTQRMLLAQNDIQSVISKYRLQEYESMEQVNDN